MKKILTAVKTAAARAALAAKTYYRRFPARCNSYILAGLLGAASALGVVVDPASARQVVAIVVPILIGGEATHRLVKPSK